MMISAVSANDNVNETDTLTVSDENTNIESVILNDNESHVNDDIISNHKDNIKGDDDDIKIIAEPLTVKYGTNSVWYYFKIVDLNNNPVADCHYEIRIDNAVSSGGSTDSDGVGYCDYEKLNMNSFKVGKYPIEITCNGITMKTYFEVVKKADKSSNEKTYSSVKLNNNGKVKIGKYTIKLSSKQYHAIAKAIKKNKPKSMTVKTKYKYKTKKPYTKKTKKYKTLRTVKTFYSVYRSEFKKMKNNGWKLVSEKTFTKKNPQNKNGIGLSAYTYSISKWVKTNTKTSYKTSTYPVYAKITTKTGKIPATIKVYSKGVTLKNKYLTLA